MVLPQTVVGSCGTSLISIPFASRVSIRTTRASSNSAKPGKYVGPLGRTDGWFDGSGAAAMTYSPGSSQYNRYAPRSSVLVEAINVTIRFPRVLNPGLNA